MLWLYIENETDILHRDGELLYLAPMDQLETRLQEWRTVVTADLQMDSVDVHADITRLPFTDSSFETVVCLHVLEHVPHDQAAMAELYRVLKPDGRALLMVPKDKDRETTYEDWSITSQEGRLEAFGQEDHVRWYGRDFGDRLAEAGFSFSTATYGREVDEELVARLGLEVHGGLLERNYEDIHHCVKEPTIERARPVVEHEARVEDVLSR